MASTKLTPEVQLRICESLEAGDEVEVACAMAGIERTTYWRWRDRGKKARSGIYRDFYDATEKARAKAAARNMRIVQREGVGYDIEKTVTKTYVTKDGTTVTEVTVTREKQNDWRAAAWWYEKFVLAPKLLEQAKQKGAGAPGGDESLTPEDFARKIKRALDAMDAMSGGDDDSDETTQGDAASADAD